MHAAFTRALNLALVALASGLVGAAIGLLAAAFGWPAPLPEGLGISIALIVFILAATP